LLCPAAASAVFFLDTVTLAIGDPAMHGEIPPKVLWALRGLATVALLLSMYLLWSTATAVGPVGCGASSGCQEVLNSRWSRWLGIPVSAMAMAVYGALLFSSLVVNRSIAARRRPMAAAMLVGAALLAAGAAIWFFILQTAVVGSVCAYCVAVHCCGLLAGGWAAWYGRSLLRPIGWLSAATVALLGIALLIAGQLLAPPKTFHLEIADSAAHPSDVNSAAPPVASFRVPGGRFDMHPGMAPTVGSPQAQHYIVMLSDYACPHCRQTHQVLQRTLARYGGRIGVIVLPTPLDRKCNAALVGSEPPAPQDCALNRLAIAVWCAEPEAFASMDRWLMAADRARLEDEARAHAIELVGEAKLAKAEADPRGDAILRQDVQLYALVKGGKLPQLLFGATHITGTLLDGDELDRAISREWQLLPAR
jgi:uncharacterized membrane protein